MIHHQTAHHQTTRHHTLRHRTLPFLALLIGLVANTANASERLYTIGHLSGPLRAGLQQQAFLLPFADAGKATDPTAMFPIVMTGATVANLDGATAKRLAAAYRAGWPLALVDMDVEAVNTLHRATGTGQVFKVAPGSPAAEAFACVQRADGGYSQMRIYTAGDPETQNRNRHQRAGGLVSWLAEARQARLQATTPDATDVSAQQDSTPQDDLTQIISAWTDSPYFYQSDSVTGLSSLYQCNVEVWQAYEVDTQMDFYYLEQNCNFSPQNTYAIRGKALDVGLPLSLNGADADWDQVSWETTTNGSTDCPNSGSGTVYTACDYYNYMVGYNVNLQPYTPAGAALSDVGVVVLEQETPPTTTESSTVTEGVSYSISGQVVAGTTNSNVSLSAGVQISTSTSTVIPDVQINNNSNTNSTNAQWAYVMQPINYVDDGCTDSMNAPVPVQTSTFTPRQDMVWGVNSSYRSMDGFNNTFDVALEFTFTGHESTMYVDEKGTRNVTNKSDCNTFGCSCGIVTGGPWTHSSGVQILSIPVPSTDYDSATAQ